MAAFAEAPRPRKFDPFDPFGIIKGVIAGQEALLRATSEQQRRYKKWQEVLNRAPEKPQWATPHKVIRDEKDENIRLLQFRKKYTGDQAPIVLVPPQAGHDSSIADRHPKKSQVRCAMENTDSAVFSLSWKPATQESKHKDIGDLVEEMHKSVEDIKKITGQDKVTLIGDCQGGWIATIYSALYPENVNHLVVAGAPIDSHASGSKIQRVAQTMPMSFFENMVAEGNGNMPGKKMLEGFKNLNFVDHNFIKPLELLNHIDDDVYVEKYIFDDNWYRWTQDSPGAFYLQTVKEVFRENRLVAKKLKDKMVLKGRVVDLKNITMPLTLVAGETDDITPPDDVFNMRFAVGTPAKNIVQKIAKGGHLGLFSGTYSIQHIWPDVMKQAASITR